MGPAHLWTCLDLEGVRKLALGLMEMATAFSCGSGNTRRWGEASRRDAGRSMALFFVQHGTFPQVHLLEKSGKSAGRAEMFAEFRVQYHKNGEGGCEVGYESLLIGTVLLGHSASTNTLLHICGLYF